MEPMTLGIILIYIVGMLLFSKFVYKDGFIQGYNQGTKLEQRLLGEAILNVYGKEGLDKTADEYKKIVSRVFNNATQT